MNAENRMNRRMVMRGAGAAALAASLPACSTIPGLGMTDAIRRLLQMSSQRAFARLTDDGGYWDQQVGRLGVDQLIGVSSGSVSSVLTSTLFKSRLNEAFSDIAVKGSERAAPLVLDAVRNVGIANAAAIVRGGPSAATEFLRDEMGNGLVQAMVPELGTAMRVASDPVVGQLLQAVSGVDVGGIAQNMAGNVNSAIWREIGVEEGAIRANPGATNDPLLMGVFGVGSRL
jgi:hypothetical protein